MASTARTGPFRIFRSLFLLLASCLALGGCAGLQYRGVMEEVEQKYYAGNLEASLERLNGIIAEGTGDQPLYLLERAIVLQRLGRFEEAEADLIAADDQIEMLDFSNATMEEVARYTLSESWTKYRGQPHEKILLNTLNILNFLAEGDLSAARIEARRAGEQYDYQVDVQSRLHYVNPLTMLLFGLVFDISLQPNNAYVAYKKAFELMGATAGYQIGRAHV